MQLSDPTVRLELLGEELRRLREAAGLRQSEAAERLGVSYPQISRIESGTRAQKCEDVAGLLAIYGVTGQERKELLQLARAADRPGLWQRESTSLAQHIAALRILESRATKMINFECEVIPGLLQTVPYIQALVRHVALVDDDELIGQRVAARIQRQAVLRKYRSPQYTAVIAENALQNVVGDKKIMREQLVYLSEVAQRANVQLRVIPRSAGNHPGFEGPFLRLSFHDRRSVIVLANRTTSLYLEEDEDLATYNNILVELLSVALDHEQSVELVRDLATCMA